MQTVFSDARTRSRLIFLLGVIPPNDTSLPGLEVPCDDFVRMILDSLTLEQRVGVLTVATVGRPRDDGLGH